MLKVEEISTYYETVQALKSVSVEVHEGEIVALVGANGAGKTTLLRTISGFIKPRRGKITFLDHDLAGLEPHKIVGLGVSQVLQGRQIFGPLTVLENLRLGAYPRFGNVPKSKIRDDMEWVFTMFPVLRERTKQKAGTLSGGEQQMLAIGRALMSRPKLLLLDEPSLGLAPIVVDGIFQTLQQLNRERLTILLVEQNAELALEVANRGYILEVGRVVLEGKTQSLLDSERIAELYLGGVKEVGCSEGLDSTR